MILAVVLLLLTVGSVVFHFMSPWWWTPIASNWDYIDTTIIITFWITGVAFVLIIFFIAYCVFRFRHREGQEAHYEPENKRLEWWLTIATSLGVAGLLAPGLVVWKDFVTVPAGASEIEVMGQQWQWSFRLPGKDGVLGKSSDAAVAADNPFGLNKEDPQAQDDLVIEAADLHLPLGKPIKVLLRSKDVLHNFYVPEFRAKMDLIPGMVTYFWFTPTRSAKFDILCFELCGTGHYTMRGSVVVEDDAAYQTWLSQQTAFRDTYQGTKVVTKAGSEVQ
jgi:cytochrome c oxidase subunit II